MERKDECLEVNLATYTTPTPEPTTFFFFAFVPEDPQFALRFGGTKTYTNLNCIRVPFYPNMGTLLYKGESFSCVARIAIEYVYLATP